MSPNEMAALATQAISAGTRMTMVLPRRWKRPPKFPRGELLCENHDGQNVYSFDPLRVLAWLAANGLVDWRVMRAPTEEGKTDEG